MKIELNEFDIELHGQVEIFYLNSKKYTGIVYENFQDYIASEFEVVEGTKNGFEKNFDPNGNMESNCTFKDGLLHGITKNYFETGELEEEANFKYGICLWSKIYTKNGELISTTTIDKNSLEYTMLTHFEKNNETCC